MYLANALYLKEGYFIIIIIFFKSHERFGEVPISYSWICECFREAVLIASPIYHLRVVVFKFSGILTNTKEECTKHVIILIPTTG